MSKPQPRAAILHGYTERISTSHGTIFLTLNWKGKGKRARPFEVFGTVGKAGSCQRADVEGLCRMITLHLRSGGKLADVIEQLRGISCCPMWVEGRLIKSVSDAIAQTLRTMYERHSL